MSGKFANLRSEVVYRASVQGMWASYETGNCQSIGWHASLLEDFYGLDYVVIEDSYGFVSVEAFVHVDIDAEGYFQPARRMFDRLADEYATFIRPPFPMDEIPDTMGYGLVVVMDDGGTLCESCLRDPRNECHDARTHDEWHDGWGVVGFTHTGECEGFLACDHCGKVLVEDDES